ncbi:MAG: cation transporter [Pseudomonadota bacterium]
MTERHALLWALILNASLAGIEIVAALWSRSVALMADAVDFVEDSTIFALALVVGASKPEAKRRFGLVVAGLMALPGLAALWQVWRQLASGMVPEGGTIWAVSALALAANLATAAVILAARRGPAPASLGLRAAWLSSRNDALANVAMIGAGVAVSLTGSGLPDIVVGVAVALLHLSGGWAILRGALAEPSA